MAWIATILGTLTLGELVIAAVLATLAHEWLGPRRSAPSQRR